MTDNEDPHLVQQAGAPWLCQEWESYASAVARTAQPDVIEAEICVSLVIVARRNKTTRTEVMHFLMSPEDAILMAQGIVHSATHTSGKSVPIPMDPDP